MKLSSSRNKCKSHNLLAFIAIPKVGKDPWDLGSLAEILKQMYFSNTETEKNREVHASYIEQANRHGSCVFRKGVANKVQS